MCRAGSGPNVWAMRIVLTGRGMVIGRASSLSATNLGPDGRTHQPHPEEAKIVSLIYQRQGRSYRQIAGELNAAGLKPRTGKQWYASTVRSVLMRRKKLAEEKEIWKSVQGVVAAYRR